MKDRKPVLWRGRLNDIADLWPPSRDTHYVAVGPDGSLTLTHADGSQRVARIGDLIGLRDERLTVVRRKGAV